MTRRCDIKPQAYVRLRELAAAFPKTSKMGKAIAKEKAAEEAIRPKPYFRDLDPFKGACPEPVEGAGPEPVEGPALILWPKRKQV